MLEKCTTIVNEEDVAKAYNSLLQNHYQDPEPTLLNRHKKGVSSGWIMHSAGIYSLLTMPSLNLCPQQTLYKSFHLHQSTEREALSKMWPNTHLHSIVNKLVGIERVIFKLVCYVLFLVLGCSSIPL